MQSDIQIARAARKKNIAEIAEISGFVSPSHFTRIFKEKEGVSPSGWRKSHLENDPIS